MQHVYFDNISSFSGDIAAKYLIVQAASSFALDEKLCLDILQAKK
jgi:hypothetical protein